MLSLEDFELDPIPEMQWWEVRLLWKIGTLTLRDLLVSASESKGASTSSEECVRRTHVQQPVKIRDNRFTFSIIIFLVPYRSCRTVLLIFSHWLLGILIYFCFGRFDVFWLKVQKHNRIGRTAQTATAATGRSRRPKRFGSRIFYVRRREKNERTRASALVIPSQVWLSAARITDPPGRLSAALAWVPLNGPGCRRLCRGDSGWAPRVSIISSRFLITIVI